MENHTTIEVLDIRVIDLLDHSPYLLGSV